MGGSSPSGSTTTTQTTSPWSGQQPYLTQGFQSAQNLFYGNNSDGSTGALGTGSYNPQYFGSPGTQYAGMSTVSPFTTNQAQGLQGMVNTVGQNSPSIDSALSSNQFLTTPGAAYSNNPSNSLYGSAASAGYGNPAMGALSYYSSGIPENANPANGYLSSTQGQGQLGNSALDLYASGAMLGAQNPAWQQLSDSVTASTLPALEGQFTQGGAMNNPNSQYAIANGLSSALAPYAEQNYNTQTTNQLNAANALSSNALSGASTLGNQYLTGTGQAINAASDLGSQYQNAIADQLAAAQGIGTNYNTANTQNIQAQAMLPSLTSANTSNAETQYQTGALQQQQNQNELNNTVNMWNYNQNLPLNMLNAYDSAISGNYGGSSTLTSPYFQNSTANALGMGLGGVSLLNGINNLSSSSGSNGLLSGL